MGQILFVSPQTPIENPIRTIRYFQENDTQINLLPKWKFISRTLSYATKNLSNPFAIHRENSFTTEKDRKEGNEYSSRHCRSMWFTHDSYRTVQLKQVPSSLDDAHPEQMSPIFIINPISAIVCVSFVVH